MRRFWKKRKLLGVLLLCGVLAVIAATQTAAVYGPITTPALTIGSGPTITASSGGTTQFLRADGQWAVPSGGGSSTWSSLSAPTGNLSLSMANYLTSFVWGSATGTSNLLSLTDTANNTGTGYLLSLSAASGSTVGGLLVNTVSSSGGYSLNIEQSGSTVFKVDNYGNTTVVNGLNVSGASHANGGIDSNGGPTNNYNGVSTGTSNTATVGYSITEKATAALSAGQLVCLDTANADSIVICPTSTTAQFVGFAQSSIAAGANGNVLVMGKAPATSTSTCSIGNYVIASSTTAGDVACTSTMPSAGGMIGFAETALASSPGTVTVLIDKR